MNDVRKCSLNYRTMENTQSQNSLVNLFKNPSQLMAIVSNPGKSGLDFYRGLGNKEKQYIAIAAGAGLIIYGLTLNKKTIK